MAVPVQAFLEQLIADHRVVVIGGLAVIAHGYGRHTEDADMWLEPMESAHEWATTIEAICQKFPGTTVHRLPGWTLVSANGIADAVEETGMVRIFGLDKPLDIFRRPNEFNELAFDEVAARAHRNADGSFLPEPLDLIQTKLETEREKDFRDIMHLESMVRTDYKKRLPSASLAEAEAMLERYSEWEVLKAALENSLTEVRELAMLHLREFAAAGDPFSQAILEGRETP